MTWLRRIALAVVGMLVLVALVAWLVLSNLDHPWVKARLVAEVKSASGFELDYRVLQLRGLSGVHVEELVVLNPPEVRAAARELARLDSLDVSWEARELPKVQQVTARGLTVVLVTDDSGASSLGPPSPKPEAQAPGLSRQLTDLLKGAPPLEGADVTGVSITTLHTGGGKVLDHLSVNGLTLTAQMQPDGTGWKLHARLGENLELIRNAAQASLKLALTADLAAAGASLGLELETSKQTFAPDLALKELLNAHALARFEPEQQRVFIELAPSRLAGVANVEGALVLPDDAAVPPVLTRAIADAQLAPLLAILPPDLVPFTLEDGTLRLDAREVTLSAAPRLGPNGSLALKATATKLQLAGLSVQDTWLDVGATPDTEGFSARATVALTTLELRGATTVRVPSGRLELVAHRLVPAPASHARVAGDVTLSVALQSLAADTGSLRAAAEKAGLELTVPLPLRGPFALRADLPLGNLRVTDAAGKRLLSAPARLQLEVKEATLALVTPGRSSGIAHVELDVGKLHAMLDATKGEDELAYTWALTTPELGLVMPFLSAETAARAPWSQLSAKLDSTGRITKLASDAPHVDHRTTLAMPRVEWDALAMRDATLALHSKGDALAHEGELELKLGQLRAGTAELGPQHVAATAVVDRRKLALRTTLETRAGPKVSLAATTAYDAGRRALKCTAKGSFDQLQAAAPLLAALKVSPAFDVTRLQATFSLDGTVSGLVESLSQAGELRLAREPAATAGFEGNVALDAAHFRWQQEGTTVGLPALKWRAELHSDGASRSVHSVLDLERLVLHLGEKRIVATMLAQDLTASITGPLDRGALTVSQTLKAATVEQRPALPVPIKNLSLSFAANREAGGLIRISDAQLTSPETRTQLSLKGTLDLSDERRQLAVRGKLEQDLAAVKLPDLFEGRGAVELGFRVASPNLSVFRTRSKLKLKDVHVKLPGSAVEVEGLEGEVAINESLELGDDGLRLSREIDANPYSMLRYADQHPLLTQNSFLTAQRIATEYGVITPFAGNLAIDQNVVSLSQLELGLRGGRITGQCTLDLQGRESTLEAHVRVTGVQSSHGEPFDGNAAVVISARERSINGRAEILRIGNQHLRDLLDIQDPQHIDPAINRVRYGLTLGYPEHLRLVFDHGFASMRISFGGAARVLKVDDVRGIPVGPLVSRALASVSLPE